MADAVREMLFAELERLEKTLASVRSALEAYDRKQREMDGSTVEPTGTSARFKGMRPTFRAIKIVLSENGNRLDRQRLVDALVAGGAILGKKRNVHNLRISIDKNIALGKLVEEGDDILLAQDESGGAGLGPTAETDTTVQ